MLFLHFNYSDGIVWRAATELQQHSEHINSSQIIIVREEWKCINSWKCGSLSVLMKPSWNIISLLCCSTSTPTWLSSACSGPRWTRGAWTSPPVCSLSKRATTEPDRYAGPSAPSGYTGQVNTRLQKTGKLLSLELWMLYFSVVHYKLQAFVSQQSGFSYWLPTCVLLYYKNKCSCKKIKLTCDEKYFLSPKLPQNSTWLGKYFPTLSIISITQIYNNIIQL